MHRFLRPALLATLAATGAQAQGAFSGGDMSFVHSVAPAAPATITDSIGMRARLGFGGGFDVQLDALLTRSVTGVLTSTGTGIGAHLSYAASDSLRLGGYVTANRVVDGAGIPTTSIGLGAEALLRLGDFTGQVYLEDQNALGGTHSTRTGIRLDYAFGQGFGLFAAYDYIDYRSIAITNAGTASLGARYRLPDMPLEISLSASRNNFGAETYAFGLTYALGGGNEGLFDARF